tara:strand:- start:45 stop:329 length:285 start_codon:yes stop_codon:yes gene_type:complete
MVTFAKGDSVSIGEITIQDVGFVVDVESVEDFDTTSIISVRCARTPTELHIFVLEVMDDGVSGYNFDLHGGDLRIMQIKRKEKILFEEKKNVDI